MTFASGISNSRWQRHAYINNKCKSIPSLAGFVFFSQKKVKLENVPSESVAFLIFIDCVIIVVYSGLGSFVNSIF